ncbi:hypothetical protein [Bacillus salipaludis]|uniref:hypothetical protein n=1 Tax=Bacillus salipaludis TaxID=2547811 RepID=UPI002E1EB580|nr:hypothetical protein [Bacillus salipaludis]
MMIKRGWLHPYDFKEQIPIDLKAAETAVQTLIRDTFPGSPTTFVPNSNPRNL